MKNRRVTSLFKRSRILVIPLFFMVSLSEIKAAQYIVKLSSDNYATATTTDTPGFQRRMSERINRDVSIIRPMSGKSIVVNIDDTFKNVRALANMPGVEYIEPDLKVYTTLVPNDPRYHEQWSLVSSSVNAGAINAEGAWDTTTGSDVVVAVIDTGILKNHEEFQGKLLPGYDFITDPVTARDGDGRDPDPTDEGDWQKAADCPDHVNHDSTWHGSHMAGIVAARGDNAKGVAGVAFSPQTKILPVRVMGLCGGSFSDIIDAVRWAAGLSVPGVADNPNPAKVINLSLGGPGACLMSAKSAFLAVYNQGVSVVAAAGNDNSNASSFTPANCDHVMSVAAVDKNGVRAGYSNFGSVIDIAAPGGYFSVDGGVLSAVDSGAKAANGDSDYAFYQGTSVAVPHVTGIAALIYSRDSTLSVDEVEATLENSARAFPVTGSAFDCTTSLCGSGLADAAAAITTAKANAAPSAGFTFTTTGLSADFSDASSDSDGSIAAWSWDFGDSASSSARNPGHLYAGGGTYKVTLKVTDNDGATDTSSRSVTVNAPPSAGFTFSTTDLTAEFRDSSSDSDGSIAAWSWDFGDGASSSAQNPRHAYTAAGSFTVTLKVTDNDGATDTASRSVRVTNPVVTRSSDGGGGSFPLLTLLLLCAYLPIGLARRRWFM